MYLDSLFVPQNKIRVNGVLNNYFELAKCVPGSGKGTIEREKKKKKEEKEYKKKGRDEGWGREEKGKLEVRFSDKGHCLSGCSRHCCPLPSTFYR